MSKSLGTEYLISDAIAAYLPESELAQLQPYPDQDLKGFPDPVTVYWYPPRQPHLAKLAHTE